MLSLILSFVLLGLSGSSSDISPAGTSGPGGPQSTPVCDPTTGTCVVTNPNVTTPNAT